LTGGRPEEHYGLVTGPGRKTDRNAKVPLDRRQFLLALAVAALAMTGHALPVLAKDGEGESSGSGSDGGGDSDSDSGSDGEGESDSGSNSGSDSGSDSDGDDGSDNSGSGSSNSGSGKDDDRDNNDDDDDDADEDEALEAVRDGEIIPLATAMGILREKNEGRVIDVRLTRGAFRDVYAFKVRSDSGRVKTIKMDARNGRIVGF
jgi:hypothetical protein